MKEVWIVMFSQKSIKSICGVFSTKDKADRYIEGVPENDRIYFYAMHYEVDVWSF